MTSRFGSSFNCVSCVKQPNGHISPSKLSSVERETHGTNRDDDEAGIFDGLEADVEEERQQNAALQQKLRDSELAR